MILFYILLNPFLFVCGICHEQSMILTLLRFLNNQSVSTNDILIFFLNIFDDILLQDNNFLIKKF